MRYCLHLIVIICAYHLWCASGISGQYGNATVIALAREYADNSAREVVMFSS